MERRSVVLALVAAVVLVAVPSVAGEKGDAPAGARILYKLKPEASPAQIGALNGVARARGLTKVKRLKGLGIEVARANQGSQKDVCADLIATGAVLFAEPDALVAPDLVPNDPSYTSQWHHPKINSAGAWNTTTGSPTVLAAVCDTGVESSHPDLAPNLQLPGYNSADGTSNSEPIMSHGTYVAGCVGAVGNNGLGVAGMSWNVKILPIRITNLTDGNAYVSHAAAGIRYAADQGAKVVNLSYRMAAYSTIADAGQYLRDRGGLLFVSAGNDGQDPGWTDFASFIAVGATDQNDNKASFSNYGTYIDCVAPGSSIRTTAPGGGTGSVSGTSFSSPITAGLATLIYAAEPSVTPAQVETAILSSCVDLGTPGEDNTFGHGRIDAAAALAAIGTPAPNTPPTASASASPTTGTAPLQVTLDGSASTDADGAITSYSWDLGDGAVASGATVSHTYAAGTYTATLTVTDDDGDTDAASVTIVVDPEPAPNTPPTAVLSASPPTGTAPLAVSFDGSASTDPDGTIVSYAWSFGDGGTASGAVVSHTYTSAGSYTATLTVTDDDGASVPTSVTIVVNPEPEPNTPPTAVLSADPATGTAPLAVTFDGSGSSDPDGTIVSYAWDFGDGASASGAVVSHTYAAGTHTATLTVTDDDGDTDTASVTIVVDAAPAQCVCVLRIAMSTRAVSGGTVACGTVTVVDGDGNYMPNATVYADWTGTKPSEAVGVTGADGKVVLESLKVRKDWTQTITVTNVAKAGYTYDPSLNLETSGTISSGTPVDQPPVAVASSDVSTGLAPLTVTFDGTGSSDAEGPIASYAWDFGDGSTAVGATPQYTYMSPGTYVATLTVTDSQGASDSDTVTITVTDGSVTTICVGSIDLVTVAVPGGTAGEATVRIINAAGAPVPNATVTGAWSGAVSGSSTAATNAAGEVVLTSRKTKKSGTITFAVTDVAAAGAVYDPASNTETAKSTSIN